MDFSPSHFFGMNFGGSRMKCLLRERERERECVQFTQY